MIVYTVNGFAAFDTRIDKPKWLTGSAATQIARRLRGKGHPVIGTQSFFSRPPAARWPMESAGRAVAWGRELAAETRAAAAA